MIDGHSGPLTGHFQKRKHFLRLITEEMLWHVFPDIILAEDLVEREYIITKINTGIS